MYIDESTNEQALLKYPATDDERMGLMINFFLHAQPFRKLNIGEITQHWGSLKKDQSKHLLSLLVASDYFIVFSKRWSTQFILKDNIRPEMILEGTCLEYKKKLL